MNILRSKKMRSLLARGKRLATAKRRPGDGMMASLINESLPNGWHYQVDWIHDTRFKPEPWIEVFAFRPGHRGCAAASHSLRSDN